MTNWYKVFYWLTVADNVKIVLAAASILTLIYVAISTFAIVAGDYNYKDWQPINRRLYRITTIIAIVTGLAWTFTPSKGDCLLIIAGGSVGNFMSSDTAAKAIPSDIAKFLHVKLQSEISEAGDDVKRQLNMQSPKEKLIDKAKSLTKEQLIEFLKSDTTIAK